MVLVVGCGVHSERCIPGSRIQARSDRIDVRYRDPSHRGPSTKDLTIAELARDSELPRVLSEIEKCDVRCANCHRVRTGEQFSWAKVVGVAIDPDTVRPGQTGRYGRLDRPVQDNLLSDESDGLRRCSRCGKRKPLIAFPFRDLVAGMRAYYCRECQAEYRRTHYAINRDDYMARAMIEARLKREDVLLRLFDYLRAHPCVDCGETDIRKLEFDHRDGAAKTMEVTKMVGRRSWSTIEQEIAKCDVRCANCHRKRTAHQQGWKVRLAEERGRYVRIARTRE